MNQKQVIQILNNQLVKTLIIDIELETTIELFNQ